MWNKAGPFSCFLRRVPACALAAAWLGCAIARPAAAQSTNVADVPAFLKEYAAVVSRAKTLYAEFVQERHLALFEDPLRSEGVLCFRKPDAIRWETTQPYRAIFTCTGEGVGQFELVDNEWRKLDLGHMKSLRNVVDGMAFFLEGRYLERQQDYTFSVTRGEDTVLGLVPRNVAARQWIEAIEIHLSPDLTATRKVILRQSGGDFTEIRFTRQVIDVVYPADVFALSNPAGLDRIRQAVNGGKP